jgi:ATP/maltotriose-dependent transcriptional regulator MalT
LAREAAQRSVEHARRAGNDRVVARIGGSLADFALLGPMPVPEAIEACEKLIADGLSDRQVESRVMCKLAQLRAMNGELETARSLYRRGRAMLRDLGQSVFATAAGIDQARVELHGGDLALAERELREDLKFLERKGERYYRSTLTSVVAWLVRDQGRDDEALELSKLAEEISATNDTTSQALWRATRAPILARAGEAALAEQLARTAVELLQATEAPNVVADAQVEQQIGQASRGERDDTGSD